MADTSLLAFGCGVTFVAIGGAYLYMRERYLDKTPRPARDERSRSEKGRDVKRVA